MITAHDWTIGTTIDPTIWERWPGYRVWLVAADDVDASRLTPTAAELFRLATDSADAADEVDGHVLRWQDAYRSFGVKRRDARPSVDALLRRAASDDGLPRPQPGSVHDVQRVAQGLIESSSGDLIEAANRFVVEVVERDADHVVAADDTRLGKSVLGAELDF